MSKLFLKQVFGNVPVNRKVKFLSIIGTSGAGQSTFSKYLQSKYPDRFTELVRTTTRPSRKDDKKEVDHRYVSEEQFEDELKKELLTVCREHYSFRYAISIGEWERAVSSGKIILAIGYLTAKFLEGLSKAYKNIEINQVGIVPSTNETKAREIVRERIIKRQPDIDSEELKARIAYTTSEKIDEIIGKVDLLIINDTDESLRDNLKKFEKFCLSI